MDEYLPPRQILFEDMSGMLGMPVTADIRETAKLAHTSKFDDVPARISSLASTVRETRCNMEQLLDARRKNVNDLLDATGGRLPVETHVSGQKTNWKFRGVEEAFMLELKALRSIEELRDRNISSESSATVKNVKVMKSKIRDVNSSICQEEQDSLSKVQKFACVYEDAMNLATQTAAQLPHIEAEFREYAAGRQQLPEPVVDERSEEELLRLFTEAEARAEQLEQQAAQTVAALAAEATQYAAIVEGNTALNEEIRDVEEECNAAARKQGEQVTHRFQRLELLATTVSRLLSMELMEQGPNTIQVTISQNINLVVADREREQSGSATGTSQSAAGVSQEPGGSVPLAEDGASPGAIFVQHVLTIEFEAPGTVLMHTASLNPPVVDISDALMAARAAQTEARSEVEEMCALTELMLDVRTQLRKHCRRQLQLEDANEVYPLQTTSVSSELLRCVLPNQFEVEVLVPMAWPEDTSARLELVAMQAPRSSQDLALLLARMQKDLSEAYKDGAVVNVHASTLRRQLHCCGLRELLDWVYGCVVIEERAVAAAAAMVG